MSLSFTRDQINTDRWQYISLNNIVTHLKKIEGIFFQSRAFVAKADQIVSNHFMNNVQKYSS